MPLIIGILKLWFFEFRLTIILFVKQCNSILIHHLSTLLLLYYFSFADLITVSESEGLHLIRKCHNKTRSRHLMCHYSHDKLYVRLYTPLSLRDDIGHSVFEDWGYSWWWWIWMVDAILRRRWALSTGQPKWKRDESSSLKRMSALL